MCCYTASYHRYISYSTKVLSSSTPRFSVTGFREANYQDVIRYSICNTTWLKLVRPATRLQVSEWFRTVRKFGAFCASRNVHTAHILCVPLRGYRFQRHGCEPCLKILDKKKPQPFGRGFEINWGGLHLAKLRCQRLLDHHATWCGFGLHRQGCCK